MSKTTILVTGGTGYIGSHMVKMLLLNGHEVVVVDKEESPNISALTAVKIISCDLTNKVALNEVFNRYKISAVFHFASYISVSESVQDPHKYYQNNLIATLNLLDLMRQYDVKKMIFSSTAAVYGMPQDVPLTLSHPLQPVNPYGKSKLMQEQILQDYAVAYGIKVACLRYFNAAGAHPDWGVGECHHPETHLIPLLLNSLIHKTEFSVFGNDYETQDGTCVRDYIHVIDICQAHLEASRYLEEVKDNYCCFNLGSGVGYSVKEIISIAEEVTGQKVMIKWHAKRAGDVSVLLADPSETIKKLSWLAKHSDIRTLISHAWQWQQYHARSFVEKIWQL